MRAPNRTIGSRIRQENVDASSAQLVITCRVGEGQAARAAAAAPNSETSPWWTPKSSHYMPSHAAVLPRPDLLTTSLTKNMCVLPKCVHRRVYRVSWSVLETLWC